VTSVLNAVKEGQIYQQIAQFLVSVPSRTITNNRNVNKVGTRFATARSMMIHFYDCCPVRPSTPDLWCITVETQVSFLYLVRF
jgi:hypothetical protein